ncbi:ribosomal RNA processing protein 36 homolog [Indicator indicator]|uniref:ribosomal RNA processing protein 36 homolog n=1 Tax=Indicator indicator TaxID=1002788 RepID=UPI0023E026C3|nr:ribosomal RNA processing protein 36 homolog [Indicator indicator]
MRPRQEGAGGRPSRAQAARWRKAATAATEGEDAAGLRRPLGRRAQVAAEGESFSDSSDSGESSDDSGSFLGVEVASSGEDEAEMEKADDPSHMSFEERLRMQSDVRMKVCKQVTAGKKTTKPAKAMVKQQQGKKGPLEMSAKKPVPFLRQVISVRKKVHRDPRFDDLSGEYKPEIFMKTYSFLDSIKKQEKEMVQKQLKKCRNTEQKEKLQQLLNRMTQQEQAQKKQQKLRERELSLKRQQRELAKQGKKPFFLKKSEKRKLELAEKYAELKRSGKLESFLTKKRKRNALKDKRRLPSQKNS